MAWAPRAAAQTDNLYDRGRFTVDVANDDFGSDVDEAFTSGLYFQIRVAAERFGWSGLVPELKARRVREYWGLVLGQEMYTPALLQVTDLSILRNDRRYAGWLHGALQNELVLRGSPWLEEGYSYLRLKLTVGATGPQTATAPLQRYWHAFIRDVLRRRRLPEDPKGWGIYEVPNHVAVNVEAAYEADLFRWTLQDPGLERGLGAQLGVRVSSLARVRAGTMWIDGLIGGVLRAGLMPEVVFDEFGMPVRRDRASALPISAYGFVSGRLIGSVYNALLDGPPGAEGPYPDRNHVLARLEAGFALRLGAVEFAFRHVTLSPELASRPPGGVWIQNWGRITLSFVYY